MAEAQDDKKDTTQKDALSDDNQDHKESSEDISDTKAVHEEQPDDSDAGTGDDKPEYKNSDSYEADNDSDYDDKLDTKDHTDSSKDDHTPHETGSKDDMYAKKSTINALVVGLVIAVGAAAFFAGVYAMSMDSQDQITQQDIDDSLAKLELKMLQQQLAERQQPQQPPTPQISADDDPVIGDPNAPITIIEFSDFECPFCERFSTQTLPAIQEEYIDKGLVKLVYRDFPLQNIHPNAVITALAAECADDQGAFKEMHDTLFATRSEWSKVDSQGIVEVLVKYADAIEIDTDEFETCVVTGEHVDDIRKDIEDGRAYGVSGTPGFYVGNDEIGYVQITGAQPFESFKRVIDAQLGQ